MTVKTTLPELIAQAAWIENQCIENPGDEAWLEAFKQVELDKAEKIDAYPFVMDRLTRAADQWKEMSEDAARMEFSLRRIVLRIKDALKFAISAIESKEAIGNHHRFKLSPCKPSLVITDKDALPPEYFMQITQVVPHKDKIRAALERGEDVPGACLEGGLALRHYLNNPNRKVEQKS